MTSSQPASTPSELDQRLLPWLLGPGLVALACVGLLNLQRCGGGVKVDRATVPATTFEPGDMPQLARVVAAALHEQPVTPSGHTAARLAERNWGLYVAVRRAGTLQGSSWIDGGTIGGSITAALTNAQRELSPEARAGIDEIELCVTHTYRAQPVRRKRGFMGNINRGVYGIELTYGSTTARYAPTEMVARNLSFERALELLMEERELGADDLAGGAVSARAFDCEQVLVQLSPAPRATLMFRGNQVVAPEEVTRDSVGRLKQLLGDWMLTNLHPDGRMTYRYWPSRGEEAEGNNMIRQWMATIALVRLGYDRQDPRVHARAADNIRYNLQHFFHVEGNHGLIEYEGKIKLGALSLAALAILEHPQRDEFLAAELALRQTTFDLQKPDGRFQTFYRPVGVDHHHNFYPGETLLYWALLYVREPSPELLERIMRSFRYYRTWHREHRNPAFIPWHIQAYVNLWLVTRDDELRDFVFEMADWLLGMQEWDAAQYPDTRGRFYDQERSYFGPPHASATGVYLEGLIDAYRLAVEVGDTARTDRYRQAMVRGLRSVMQLQFVDEIDMFYIHKRELLRGGVRTTVYDNAIRVDNVQHNLLGIFRIHQILSDGDYRP